MTKANIFLSYRRDDSESETRNIQTALSQGGHTVFIDRSIQPGDRWKDEIKNALKNADIILAVIGNKWLTVSDPDGRRRIDGDEDWVRFELRTALETGKTIIPVLINRASLPSPRSLPPDLKDLCNWQAMMCTPDNWEHDIPRLLQRINSLTGEPKPKPIFLLTSESPRRKELLKQIGWEEGVDYFTMHASVSLDADHGQTLSLQDAKEFAQQTACSKIDWVMDHLPSISEKLGSNWTRSTTILIGVDTIVFCKGKILDRPLLKAIHLAGPEEIESARIAAKEMLMEQKGEKIYIITSMAIALTSNYENPYMETVVTEAKLRSYSEEEVDNYIFYSQPFDKAGAFGIQEKGISLFEKIKGSYTNVVGLPLQEFVDLLHRKYGEDFELPELKSSLPSESIHNQAALSVACVGDINYDYIYDKFPEDFFVNIQPPGKKVIGPIHRGVGGTAVNFAKGAKKAGFSPCYVIGMIGGDALGTQIQHELHARGITAISKFDPHDKTSIAIIFRNTAQKDTSITLTDAYQSLPNFVVGLARETIEGSDVFYSSGYCLIDKNRRASAIQMMRIAREAHQLVLLDVVVGMSKPITWNELEKMLNDEEHGRLVDVIISELPEIFEWLGVDITDQMDEMAVWQLHSDSIVKKLRKKFQVAILRTSNYTHEIIITSDEIIGPELLDYSSLGAWEKVGYGDFRTAKQMHSFLSPRIVLASKSPQRFQLLSQIAAPSKIQVVVSNSSEERVSGETPQDRVQRLAMKKAEAVFKEGNYHDDIELIIGADTEIIRKREDDTWEMIGHPQNTEEAIQDLTSLNGKSHFAITGMAILGRDPGTDQIKRFTCYVETKITFGNLSPEQLRSYAETGEPIARAGAYAIQGLGTMLIKDLDGSYSNVVGLPLERLSEVLAQEFKKPVWLFDKVSNWSFPVPIKRLRLS